MDVELMPIRSLSAGQQTQVWTCAIGGDPSLVFSSSELLLEAPNWAQDGNALLLNGAGRLWRLDLAIEQEPGEATLGPIDIDGLPPINNDHVVHPDQASIYLSAGDDHIYRAPVAGGTATRITHDDKRLHFLHGISPDGATLAYVDLPRDGSGSSGRLALMDSNGGEARYPEAGTGHLDGPEYSPDGRWIYLNTEHFASAPGHAQLARLPVSGGALEQLVQSGTVDWFPHLAPDGAHATYVAFPAGTLGHPADRPVEVRLVDTGDWATPLTRIPLPGGQGTLNVNSWAPDSTRFAYVSYPAASGES